MELSGLWAFLAIVVLAGTVEKIIRHKITMRAQQNQNSGAQNAEILARLEKLERRMSNIETIVLESEKHKQFDRAL